MKKVRKKTVEGLAYPDEYLEIICCKEKNKFGNDVIRKRKK